MRTINYQTPEMSDAMLRLMTALELQDMPGVKIKITFELPKPYVNPRRIGEYYGAVTIFEEFV